MGVRLVAEISVQSVYQQWLPAARVCRLCLRGWLRLGVLVFNHMHVCVGWPASVLQLLSAIWRQNTAALWGPALGTFRWMGGWWQRSGFYLYLAEP